MEVEIKIKTEVSKEGIDAFNTMDFVEAADELLNAANKLAENADYIGESVDFIKEEFVYFARGHFGPENREVIVNLMYAAFGLAEAACHKYDDDESEEGWEE